MNLSANLNLVRFIPFISALKNYQRAYFSKDLIAGLTVGISMIPIGLAYGQLSGLPLAALYASLLPLVAYALFSSSKELIVGPSAALSIFIAVSLEQLDSNNIGTAAIIVASLTMLSGIFCVLASIFRLGFISDFLSKPIMVGFMHGLAVVIIISSLTGILGYSATGGDNAVYKLNSIIQGLHKVHFITFGIGISGILIILACQRWLPRVSGQIIVMVLSILLVYFFRLDLQGVKIIGSIPEGLPSFDNPFIEIENLLDLQKLFPLSLAMTMLIMSETVSKAEAFASRGHYAIDANQQMLADGLANIASAFTHGVPVSGSSSRSAIAISLGTCSQVTSLIAAFTIAITISFFTNVLFFLPTAALSAIVIAAAFNLIKFDEFRKIQAFHGKELAIALMTMLSVIILGVMNGVIVGVVFAIVTLLYGIKNPDHGVLGRDKKGFFHSVERHRNVKEIPGIIIYRFSSPIVYFNCQYFHAQMMELAHSKVDTHSIIIEGGAIYQIDFEGSESLGEIYHYLKSKGIKLKLINFRSNVRTDILRNSTFDAASKELFYYTISLAIAKS